MNYLACAVQKTAWDGRLVAFLGQANQSLLEWGG